MSKLIYKELSDQILDAAFSVHNIVGCGFLESLYEDCMCIELKLRGINFDRQKIFNYQYKGRDAGGYVADMVVENKIILEFKSVSQLNNVMKAQIINYLKVSGLQVGYLFNFNSLCLEWQGYVLQRG